MKGILLLNGQPYTGEIPCDNARTICCDGAYGWAKNKVRIDENIGDFDSLSYTPFPPPTEIFPSEKNFTDGEIGLQKLIDYGCTEIEIYGGGGGREDHFLGNLHLLYRASRQGIQAKMYTDTAEIFLARGVVHIKQAAGKTLSLLPFGGNAHIIDSEGLKYPLRDLTLFYGSCRGISNVAEADDVRFECVSGIVLVLLNKQ